jgi:CBS domain-containing protein
MRAIDLSPPTVFSADESTSLADAAKLMREKGVGDLVVTRRDKGVDQPIGIVTDRDIVVRALACDLEPQSITVADLCTRKPVTVSTDADLMEITSVMNECGVRRVLVTRDLALVGIVTMDKVIQATAELLNNLSEMLGRQFEYEQSHIATPGTRSRTA